MIESPRQFHFNAIADNLRNAIRKGEISTYDAETITLHLAERFRRDPRDFDPYDPVPRARLWPWVAGAVAFVAVPVAVILLLDLGGLR